LNSILYDHASVAPAVVSAGAFGQQGSFIDPHGDAAVGEGRDVFGDDIEEADVDRVQLAVGNAVPVLPLTQDSAQQVSTACAAALGAISSQAWGVKTAPAERREMVSTAVASWAASMEKDGHGIPSWYCPPSEWAEREHASLWGPTCDGFDCVASDIMLPRNLKAGDMLLFDSAGAYTKAAGTTFNGFDMPRTVYIAEDEEWDYDGPMHSDGDDWTATP